MKFLLLIAKNVSRNALRSVLTALGTMVLVLVVVLVWSMLWFLEMATAQRSENLKAIVTERWSVPSRLPFSYAQTLSEGAAREPGDVKPLDSMTWQFYGGTLEPNPAKLTRETMVFAISMDPGKVFSMMEGMDSITPEDRKDLERVIAEIKVNKQGIVLGKTQLANLNKQVGERLKLFGFGSFKGLDFEFEILGTFPAGRYDGLAAMHYDYFNNQLESYAARNHGRKHPLADRSLNLVWLKLPDEEAFNRVASQIESSPYYKSPAVKVETASSGIASFMEGFRDLLWGMNVTAWMCVITLALVIANAISISVRERQLELAVMKVLGFQPWQVLVLVLGEALLLGGGAGLASGLLTYSAINWGFGGLKFPMAFFDTFLIPGRAILWGTAAGAAAALVGGFLPAWSARNVKAAEVFSKVA